jgi:pumilio RNA-binding family
MIFQEILPEAFQLMNDVFGNYVVQKLFEYGTPGQRATLAEQLIGNVLKLT